MNYSTQVITIAAPSGNLEATVIESPDIIIRSPQDALDLMASASTDYIVVHEHNIDPSFFDLSTRVAGEILQKFSNYYKKIAIIGSFEKFPSKTLKDFIYESNKSRGHIFVHSLEEVKQIWGRN